MTSPGSARPCCRARCLVRLRLGLGQRQGRQRHDREGLGFLDNPELREKAIATGTAEDAYLALWSIAFDDANAAIEPAGRLLDDADAGRRFVAIHLLGQLGLPEKTLPYLLKAYDDEDLRIALRADSSFDGGGDKTEIDRSDLFECAERLLGRLPEKTAALKPIVWPWQVMVAHRWTVVNTLLNYRGDRPPSRLIKHLPAMDSSSRASVVRSIVEADSVEPETREILLQLAADPSPGVRELAIGGLAKSQVTLEEAVRLEDLLSRKADDLRRGVLTLLFNQDEDAVLVEHRSAARGQEAGTTSGGPGVAPQPGRGRSSRVEDCRIRATAYRDAHPKLDPDEARQIQAILDAGRKRPDPRRRPGTVDPAERTRPVAPVARKPVWLTPGGAGLPAVALVVHPRTPRDAHLDHNYDGGVREELLGNVRWGFPDAQTAFARCG